MNQQQNPRPASPHPGLTPAPKMRERVNRDSSAASSEMPEHRRNPPFPDPTKRLDRPAFEALANLMVGYRIQATFHALADPTRRALLDRLASGEKSVAELTRGFAMSDTGAAKHLAVLEAAGLVRRRREGRRSLCALDADPLVEAGLWLRRWDALASPRAANLRAMHGARECVD
jgi:DNA-binding transcriptional ArsR family regulator